MLPTVSNSLFSTTFTRAKFYLMFYSFNGSFGGGASSSFKIGYSFEKVD